MFKKILTSMALLATALLVACGGGGGSSSTVVTPPTLTSIAVTPTAVTLISNQTKEYSAMGTYSDGTTKVLKPAWSSSDTNVAQITSAGLAQALNPGTTTIKATSDGVSGSAILTTTADTITSITISPAYSPSYYIGTVTAFTALGKYASGSLTGSMTTSVTWVSSDSTVASISSTGLVTAKKAGTTTITGTYAVGVTATYDFKVSSASVTALAITGLKSGTSIYAQGSSTPLGLSATYSDSGKATVNSSSWNSSSVAIATVEGGLLKTLSTGSTIITVTLGGLTATQVITVAAPVASVVTLSCNSTSPMNISAGAWNTAYTNDPSNNTKWLVIDQTTCGSYTNGVLLAIKNGTSSSQVAKANIASGTGIFNPAVTLSSGKTPEMSSGDVVYIGSFTSLTDYSSTFFFYNILYSIQVGP
jgi:hypothetical protein